MTSVSLGSPFDDLAAGLAPEAADLTRIATTRGSFLRTVIDELPVWPFDASTLRRFLTAYVIPMLIAALLLTPATTWGSPILLAQLPIESKGTAAGPAPGSVPFFLAYYPLIDPTSSETIMLGAPFVPVGFHGSIIFRSPAIDPVVTRLKDHIEERLGGSTLGLIAFPPETSPYWGTDAIRDTWTVDQIRLRVGRAEVSDRVTEFDYDIVYAWQVYGSGDVAPSAVPEPPAFVLLGLTVVAIARRLKYIA